jgi:hypothetical protein
MKQWYNNHARGTASSTSERHKILNFKEKAKRRKQGWQVYSKLYYKEKLRRLIQESWEKKYRQDHPELDEDAPIPRLSLSFRNQKTRELFEAEKDEIKQEVATAQKADLDSGDDEDNDEGEDDDPDGDEHEHKRLARLAGYLK